MLVGAKVKSIGDFDLVCALLEKVIGSFKGKTARDAKLIKTLRWRLADCYYITEKMDKALTLYQSILSNENGFIARPTLACQIINIKMKSGIRISAQDIMNLPKPSEYKLTMKGVSAFLLKTGRFLNVKLDGMMSHGLMLKDVFEEAVRGKCRYTCFYMSERTLKIIKDLGKDPTFPNIDAEIKSLKEVLTDLFGEMRSLGSKIKDVYGLEDDWVEDTRLYYRLVDAFPSEEIIHHYRATWLWKYQFAIYFPRLHLALDYRGRAVQDPKNYARHTGGRDEYLRLCDRTMKKAESEYGIHVEVISQKTEWNAILGIVTTYIDKVATPVEIETDTWTDSLSEV